MAMSHKLDQGLCVPVLSESKVSSGSVHLFILEDTRESAAKSRAKHLHKLTRTWRLQGGVRALQLRRSVRGASDGNGQQGDAYIRVLQGHERRHRRREDPSVLSSQSERSVQCQLHSSCDGQSRL